MVIFLDKWFMREKLTDFWKSKASGRLLIKLCQRSWAARVDTLPFVCSIARLTSLLRLLNFHRLSQSLLCLSQAFLHLGRSYDRLSSVLCARIHSFLASYGPLVTWPEMCLWLFWSDMLWQFHLWSKRNQSFWCLASLHRAELGSCNHQRFGTFSVSVCRLVRHRSSMGTNCRSSLDAARSTCSVQTCRLGCNPLQVGHLCDHTWP